MGDDVSTQSTEDMLSAGSVIPLPFGSVGGWIIEVAYFGITPLDQWDPMVTYWELYNPSNEIAYRIPVDLISAKHLGHFPPFGMIPGYDKWEIYIANPNIQIPAFAQAGSWKLNLVICDEFEWLGWDIRCATVVSYVFSVGESSYIDSFLAPIYITYNGMAVTGWGKFSFALPGLFWLSCPIWGYISFIILTTLWFRSFRSAKAHRKVGWEKVMKGLRRNGGKKDVKKTET